jgi:YD repeat-containing protein
VPDAFERLWQIQYPQGALGYTYSPTTGQLVTTTTPAGETTTFAYDGFLTTSISWSGPVVGSISFGYNTDFRVTSQSLNGGSPLGFGYDADGLLTLTCPRISDHLESQNRFLRTCLRVPPSEVLPW